MYKLFLGLLFTFIFASPPVKTPVITGTYCGVISAVNGTCAEKDGTSIEVFKNGTSTGTVTLTNNDWTITGVSFSPGDKVTAQATNDQGQSAMSDTVTVGTDPTPANAGTDQTLCNVTTATLGGNSPSTGTGKWTVITGGATVTDPTNPASGVTNLAAAVNTFRWTITNISCTSADDISIIIRAPTPTADAGPDQNLCSTTSGTLAGNSPSPGTGIWTVVAGGATVDAPSDPNSTVSNLGTGANTFRWTISNAPCTSSSDDITINVGVLPSTANAGADQTLCNATTCKLDGTVPLIGTGKWIVVTGGATVNTPTDAKSDVSNLSIGVNTFRWSVWTLTNPLCTSTDDVTIISRASAPAANAGTDQTLCNATTATLGGNDPSPGTGVWTVIAGGATVTDPANPVSGVTNLAMGINTFRWTISNAPCAGSTDDVTINVQTGTVANAGPNQTLCNATSATLAGNAPGTGTGAWTKVSGSGTVTTPGSPTSGITGLTAGKSVFKWTITDGPCVSTDDVSINVSAPATVANAGADQSLCNATVATLAGNTPATGTGAWTKVSGNGTITTASSPTSGITGLTVGTSVFRWTITNGPCVSTDDVSISISTSATAADAGPDQSICNASITSLAGNAPVTGTGGWSKVSGNGTITNAASSTSGVTGLTTGSSVFRWTITNGACVSTDDVTITVNDPPTTANAGPDQTLCANMATLAGNNALSGKGTWTVIAGGATVTSPANPVSGVTNLTQGINTFRWTISNDPCTASLDDVILTVNGTLTAANAGTDQTLCNAGTTTLAGNTPVTGAGTWTKFSGSGTITTAGSPASGITGLTVGTSVFVWTISNPPCTPSSDTVAIINSAPSTVPNAGQDQTLCNTGTATLAGNTPVTGTGIWTKVSGSGTIVTPANPGSGITGLAAGKSVFIWTITNGACTASDDVTIDVDSLTAANAGTDQTLCNATTTTLSGNVPAAGTGTWTKISGSGNITSPGTPASGVTGLTAGTSVFRWTLTNGTCTSADDVAIILKSSPTAANAGPDQTLCSSNAILAGNTPVTGTGTWTKISGSGNITSPGTPASGVTGLTAGTSVFRWTISNGGCSSSDSMSIINGNVPVVNAGPDQSLCNSTGTTLAGNTPPPGITGAWSVVAGGATVASPSNPASAVTNLSAGKNIFRWTIKDGACIATDSITVNANVTPIANAGPDQIGFSSIATLAGNTPLTGTGLWTVVTGSATVTVPSNPKSGVTGLSPGLNTFRWTISAPPCQNSSDDVNINVTPMNVPPVANNDTVVLPEDSFLSINVQANDYDANFDSLTTSVITPPANGKAILNGKKIVYFPDKNFNGKDNIVYSVCDSGAPPLCDTARVLITVTPVNDPPSVRDTLLTAYQNTSGTICIPISDVDGAQAFTASSCHDPVHGTYSSTITGNLFCITYTPGSGYMGLDSICIVVCDNGSPSFCDTALVFIKVIEKPEVVFEIPQGFSPNGDGVNDLFVIQGIEKYPDNHIIIFNQWGNKVFEQHPYTNKWNGSYQKEGLSGNELPVGTYYFVLDLGNGSDPFKKYVYISR